MNLNVHFHVAVPDGVFTSGQGAARADFCRLPTLDRLDVETLTVNVEMGVVSWLRRNGFLTDDSSEPPADPAARSALEACLLGSLGLGELSALATEDRVIPPAAQRQMATRAKAAITEVAGATPSTSRSRKPSPTRSTSPRALPASDS